MWSCIGTFSTLFAATNVLVGFVYDISYSTYFYVVVKVRPTSLSSHTPFLLLSTLEVTRMINVFVVFTLNRSFYPVTSAVPPVSLLILHPREIKITWTQLSVRHTKPKRYVKNQGRHIKC